MFACVFASPRSSPKTVESLPCLMPDTYGTAVNLSQQNQVCFLDTFEGFSCSTFSSNFSFKPHLAKAVEMCHQSIQVGVGGISSIQRWEPGWGWWRGHLLLMPPVRPDTCRTLRHSIWPSAGHGGLGRAACRAEALPLRLEVVPLGRQQVHLPGPCPNAVFSTQWPGAPPWALFYSTWEDFY